MRQGTCTHFMFFRGNHSTLTFIPATSASATLHSIPTSTYFTDRCVNHTVSVDMAVGLSEPYTKHSHPHLIFTFMISSRRLATCTRFFSPDLTIVLILYSFVSLYLKMKMYPHGLIKEYCIVLHLIKTTTFTHTLCY